jgi:hypothetical protein
MFYDYSYFQVHACIFLPLALYQGVSKITLSNYKCEDYSHNFTLYTMNPK